MFRTRKLAPVAGVVSVAVLTAGFPAASGARSRAIFHHPRIPIAWSGKKAAGWAASNWSGYAITGFGFKSVTGQWTVPTVMASRKATYSSNGSGSTARPRRRRDRADPTTACPRWRCGIVLIENRRPRA